MYFWSHLESKRMSNNFFKFKQFTVFHDRCAMKVGTDGVLLGAWVCVENARRVLDVGAGSGLISLQIAQRNKAAKIVAVEIDKEAAQQALENIEASPWGDRIQVICNDFRYYEDSEKFDAIVSNPPYFIDALRSPDAKRRLARHTEELNYHLLFQRSKSLLAPQGHVSIIVPSEVEKLVMDAAWEYNFYPSRRTNVYTKPLKPCRRILFEFKARQTTCEENDLYIENGAGGYSDEYIALTRDFYLYMD